MEDAYTALYQEFLCLQSLCKKQAAMLQKLTEALRRQQGVAPLSNGHFQDLVSIPVQCTEDEETFAYPGVPAKAAQVQALALHTRADANLSPLAGALDRLQLGPSWGEAGPNNHDQAVSVDSQRQQGTQQTSIVDELREAEQRWHSSQAAKQTRRPWSSSFMNSEMLSQAGGMLMSRVTLQSQVCEFCHAVFPGHTTTKGEFLRHLTTHTT
ncbi:uncharacterized protein [Salminus brasiliensis]|uniref:uncharacterized protein isoform X2 n=1 Tax=Salminus brasiliensis TaxID=930266 RepID=UPI003B82E719